jgi:hypothetical protein
LLKPKVWDQAPAHSNNKTVAMIRVFIRGDTLPAGEAINRSLQTHANHGLVTHNGHCNHNRWLLDNPPMLLSQIRSG